MQHVQIRLVGPITAYGGQTYVTSQTGTGSTFAMKVSPQFTTPDIGAATGASLSVTGQLVSTAATGTAPLSVNSVTKVPNLNVDLLDGGDWASPGNIGTNAPGTAAFTTATTTGAIDVGGGTNISPKRSSFSGNSEPYSIAAKYNSSGSPVYFGATDATTTPGFQISNAGGGNIINGTNAGNIAIAGALAITGALSGVTTLTASGDVAINTNKFNVTASNGNTAIAGTLAVTGAITGAQQIDIGGGSNISAKRSSFSGNSEPYSIAAKYNSGASGVVYFGATDATSTPGFQISNNGGGNIISGTNGGNITVSGALAITGALSGVTTLAASGAATLSSTLDVTGAITGSSSIADSKGDVRTIPQNSKSAAYTTVLSDAGKHILHPSADTTARTFTIDSNANVAYSIGTAITFVNQNSAGTVTISITSDTMRLAGAGTTGSRTLAANGIATALKITSTEWIISGTNLT